MTAPIFHMIEQAPTPVGPFCHATEVDGWVFLTGQMPTDPDDADAALPDGIEAQTHRVMDNLILVLKDIGLSLTDVVSVRIFLTEFKRDFCPMNDIYK
ncbi:MAG TPA: RidA family protein, partial [Marinobacter sp.]|nr:RidA family protein [Marinobacter sp.]